MTSVARISSGAVDLGYTFAAYTVDSLLYFTGKSSVTSVARISSGAVDSGYTFKAYTVDSLPSNVSPVTRLPRIVPSLSTPALCSREAHRTVQASPV